MIVVADTSPLNYLIRIGQADILKSIYGSVVAPPAVLVEMQHSEAPDEVRSWAAAPPRWLQEIPVQRVDESLPVELGAGEREAISLAMELRADVLLIDEYAGRREAEARHLLVTGTLAVLLQGSLRGYLDLPNELERLKHIGFRVSRSVEAAILARHDRLKRQT